MPSIVKVNEDLVRERSRCTFDVQELTYLVDGGKEKTAERKKVEDILLSIDELKDPIPEEYLSHKERYENAVRKSVIIMNLFKEKNLGHCITRMNTSNYWRAYRLAGKFVKDVLPFKLHLGMFIPTLLGQASPEQLEKWLPRAMNTEIIGTYAQTELGHGTFLRGLETTATYDPSTEEFVIESPTLTSHKWWPGGLGHTANHCIIVAQLYTNGRCHGVHPFITQIRCEKTHKPLPGVTVGEIGPKMGFQTANNGFLGFKGFRIPRNAMLMKNAQILKDGTYIRAKNDKLTYGTMVLARVVIVNDVAFTLSQAATIAVRYSAVRRQSKPKANEPEPQILDYLTQQHTLFIVIATSHALRMVGDWLWDTYTAVFEQMRAGTMDQLPELHALACCLKAVSTRDGAACAEQCRLVCGGHGYMTSSYLPILYGIATAANTYEGDNTVLLLQTARFLMKAWQQASENKSMTPSVSYLIQNQNKTSSKWDNTPECIIRGMKEVAAGWIKMSAGTLEGHVRSGTAYEDAWNCASVQLVGASEAHCRAVLCEVYWNETQRVASAVSKELGIVLNQLMELYLIYWALAKTGDLLLYSNVSKDNLESLRARYEQLLVLIRPNAVGLVDAFDLRDESLNSTLGAYDGRVYERLMEEALKSPLNAEPVNQSFHKYLKPFMQGKL